MTPLSEHFSLEELTFSEAALRHHIGNRPDGVILARLKATAWRLEDVRALLGGAIRVTSGYRTPAVNAIIGGAVNSAHTLGYAVDFTSGFGTPYEVCQAIARSGIAYDQLIHEYGAWTHISFDPRMRRESLTIGGGVAGYRAGLARS